MSLFDRFKDKVSPSKDPLERLRKSQTFRRAKKHVQTVSALAKAINDMGENPSLRNWIALGMTGVTKWLEYNEVSPVRDKAFGPTLFNQKWLGQL
jgi:hypothetical protein